MLLKYVDLTVPTFIARFLGPFFNSNDFYKYVFLEEANFKRRSRIIKTKPQGSKMMKQQLTKITGTCNLCSSSRQQQVLDILRFILDRIKRCQPMDNNSNRRRINRRFLSRSIATSSQWNYHSRNLKCSSSISSRITGTALSVPVDAIVAAAATTAHAVAAADTTARKFAAAAAAAAATTADAFAAAAAAAAAATADAFFAPAAAATTTAHAVTAAASSTAAL